MLCNRQIYEKSQVNHWKLTNPKLTEGCLFNTILMPWNKIIPLICSDLLTKLSACFYNQTGLSQTLFLPVEEEHTLCNASNSSNTATSHTNTCACTHTYTQAPSPFLSCRLNVNSPDIQPCLQPMITSQLINPDSINVNYSDTVCVCVCARAFMLLQYVHMPECVCVVSV